MLAQPLECDDPNEDGCETEDKTEEPEGVDADVGGRRGKFGIHETLRNACGSVCSSLKLGEDAQQKNVG